MSSNKKILFWALLLLSSLGLLVFIKSPLSLAAPNNPLINITPITASGFEFTSADTIQGTITINGTSTVVTFYDQNISNGNTDPNFAIKSGPDLNNGPFCTDKLDNTGVNLVEPFSTSSASLTANLVIGEWIQNGASITCQQVPVAQITPSPIPINNPLNAAAASYYYTPAGDIACDANLCYDGEQGQARTFTAAPTNIESGDVFIDNTTPNKGQCNISGIIVTDGANNGTLYQLGQTAKGGGPAIDPSSPIYAFLTPTDQQSCTILDTDGVTNPSQITIAGNAPAVDLGPVCDPTTDPNCTDCAYEGSTLVCHEPPTGGNGGCTPDATTGVCPGCTAGQTTPECTPSTAPPQPSCYTGGLLKQIFSLEWILCPALHYIDVATENFDDTIQSLLTFDTSKYLCGGGVDTTQQDQATNCTDASQGSKDTTYHAWSTIRDIASGLLVIVMLIIVISQALA